MLLFSRGSERERDKKLEVGRILLFITQVTKLLLAVGCFRYLAAFFTVTMWGLFFCLFPGESPAVVILIVRPQVDYFTLGFLFGSGILGSRIWRAR